MEKDFARKLVKDVLEYNFERRRFAYLIRELLNHIEETPQTVYRGNYIPDAYEGYIKTLDRVGKYEDPDKKKIDILVVHLKKEASLERARTMQRNFVAWYLNGSRGGVLKDAALVAFVSPAQEDWRFSFVKMEYKLAETLKGVRAREEFTPARRYSFLVGRNETSHTAQSRLVPILLNDEHNPTLKELEDAFGIEKVTREFYEKYRELFLKLKESLEEIVQKDKKIKADFEAKNVDTVDFAKKLLGQIVFLYFLQKKGWFGVKRGQPWGEGSRHFLRELFDKKHGNYKNLFNDILEPLFYEALRLERPGDYYSRFDCRIPFLNGGLFDPINEYDWVDTDILLPNELFSNTEKTKQGDIGTGILDVFDRYNFTVKEDEPLEKEVAIDPEMLGKVFENLLEVKDRKSKGTYYTPREIVHYMCQQSLINYLDTAVNAEKKPIVPEKPRQDKFFGEPESQQMSLRTAFIQKEDIAFLIQHGQSILEHDKRVETEGKETKRYPYRMSQSIRENAVALDNALESIRICDPAVGSGAFLVGMMHEIVNARSVLSTYLNGSKNRMPYNFKRDAIQNCLYGVDIDPGAVEIAKLRLWLSLIVDEEDIRHIKPLPNLDYKIICGNSLLGVERNLLNHHLLNKLEELKPIYFNETNARKKQDYKEQIDELIEKITNSHRDFDFEVYFSEVFHGKGGFDITIANPPYVEHKKLKKVSSLLKNRYQTYSGTTDLYVYFYEKGLNLLKNAGVLTFISSNKFMRTSYGAKLRGLLAEHKIQQIVDFTKIHVFDALVASCIMVVSKEKDGHDVVVSFADDTITDFGSVDNFIRRKHILINSERLGDNIWQLEDTEKIKLKTKIERGCKKINELKGVKIFRGVTTGCNESFVVDRHTAHSFVKDDPDSKQVIKRLLQGRNIRKWAYKPSSEFLLFVPWHFPLHTDRKIVGASTKAETEFKKLFPSIYKHLLRFKEKLENRNKEETGKRYEWYALQRCAASYYPEFEKEKIIWGLTADKWAFAYDDKKHYLPSNGYILTSERIPLKYLLALLNSNLIRFYFGFVGIMTAGGAFTLKHETIGELPIKDVSAPEQKPFISTVDKILAITKDDDYLENSTKQAKVKDLEKQINQMVYKLYELTDDEIKIVEGENE
jgi:hypothetical protein